MRVRKRRPARPGEEFLEALASGRDDEGPTDEAEVDDADVPAPAEDDDHARLMATEQRAYTAEEALRQLRIEADSRLEDAREAITRERALRVELEQRLTGEAPPPAEEPTAPAEADLDAWPTESAPAEVSDGGEGAPAWPTPWIDSTEAPSGGRRRRLFGRR